MDRLIVDSHGFYDLIVHPHFSDRAGDFTGYYNGTLSEFTVADDIPLDKGIPMIDLFARQNILQRRDASCKTNWSQVLRGSTRRLSVDELYGAIEDCQQEFYQGSLKDFRDKSDKFKQIVLDRFKKAMGTDIATNSYFGDVTRQPDTTDKWSWNKFDGLFTKYAKYATGPAVYRPTILDAIPEGEILPADAYGWFDAAYTSMNDEMEAGLLTDLGFFVDRDLAYALWKYYRSIGEKSGNIGYYQNGIPSLSYNGIPIYVEPTWKPVLRALNGGVDAHALILTYRGNFVYGTNSSYGDGPNMDEALSIWYSYDDGTWKQKMYHAGGVDVASPQNTVMAMTNIS